MTSLDKKILLLLWSSSKKFQIVVRNSLFRIRIEFFGWIRIQWIPIDPKHLVNSHSYRMCLNALSKALLYSVPRSLTKRWPSLCPFTHQSNDEPYLAINQSLHWGLFEALLTYFPVNFSWLAIAIQDQLKLPTLYPINQSSLVMTACRGSINQSTINNKCTYRPCPMPCWRPSPSAWPRWPPFRISAFAPSIL